jgi:hypothetical protein
MTDSTHFRVKGNKRKRSRTDRRNTRKVMRLIGEDTERVAGAGGAEEVAEEVAESSGVGSGVGVGSKLEESSRLEVERETGAESKEFDKELGKESHDAVTTAPRLRATGRISQKTGLSANTMFPLLSKAAYFPVPTFLRVTRREYSLTSSQARDCSFSGGPHFEASIFFLLTIESSHPYIEDRYLPQSFVIYTRLVKGSATSGG